MTPCLMVQPINTTRPWRNSSLRLIWLLNVKLTILISGNDWLPIRLRTDCSRILSFRSGKVTMSGVMVGQVGQIATANLKTVKISMRQFVKSMAQSANTMEIMVLWLVRMRLFTTMPTITVPR